WHHLKSLTSSSSSSLAIISTRLASERTRCSRSEHEAKKRFKNKYIGFATNNCRYLRDRIELPHIISPYKFNLHPSTFPIVTNTPNLNVLHGLPFDVPAVQRSGHDRRPISSSRRTSENRD